MRVSIVCLLALFIISCVAQGDAAQVSEDEAVEEIRSFLQERARGLKGKGGRRGKGGKGARSQKPNIIFLLADDLGYNDIGYLNDRVRTPNLDRMAKRGVILDQSYFQPVCTPSRGALMTGQYPFKTGMQHIVIRSASPECAPLDKKLLPEALKEQGYSTHLIGKWHLGFCDWKCTPTERGFDSFYGFYQGYIDHYTHMIEGGYDWRINKKAAPELNGTYSTDLIRDRVKTLIRQSKKSKDPFFLYTSFAAPHGPLEAPAKYDNMYMDEPNEDRRVYLRMITAVDDAVGEIMAELKSSGQHKNTLVVFASDNGGEEPGASNHPLRGTKGGVFEGGVHVPSFVWGPGILEKSKYRHNGMIHVTDWYPTFVALAGGKAADDIDGIDQSAMLFKGEESLRNEIPIQIDSYNPPLNGKAAIRLGDYKLIEGFPGLQDGYFGQYYYTFESRRRRSAVPNYKLDFAAIAAYAEKTKYNTQLYNIKEDPEERNDIASSEPAKVAELKARLDFWRLQEVSPDFASVAEVPEGAASNFGGIWSPGWCTKDEEGH